MTTTGIDGLTQFKQQTRVTWAAGDYDAVSEPLWTAGREIVRRVGVGVGDEVLDVACGTGNAAVQAAVAGGRVTGLDLTPELFGAARARAAEAGVEVELVEGDAEALPFPDDSFDVVLSTFGVMFAPRHEVAAGELARVLRPGGRMGLCHWTPEGRIGAFFATVGAHLPPPPDFTMSPVLWGDEDHVRALFAGTGVELSFARAFVDFRFDAVDEAVAFYEEKFGPLVKARAQLEPEGRWPALRADFAAYFEESALPDGRVDSPGEYLIATGAKHA
jgi:SAM-dependent methyltransferase